MVDRPVVAIEWAMEKWTDVPEPKHLTEVPPELLACTKGELARKAKDRTKIANSTFERYKQDVIKAEGHFKTIESGAMLALVVKKWVFRSD